jgi:hypothetical protein
VDADHDQTVLDTERTGAEVWQGAQPVHARVRPEIVRNDMALDVGVVSGSELIQVVAPSSAGARTSAPFRLSRRLIGTPR